MLGLIPSIVIYHQIVKHLPPDCSSSSSPNQTWFCKLNERTILQLQTCWRLEKRAKSLHGTTARMLPPGSNWNMPMVNKYKRHMRIPYHTNQKSKHLKECKLEAYRRKVCSTPKNKLFNLCIKGNQEYASSYKLASEDYEHNDLPGKGVQSFLRRTGVIWVLDRMGVPACFLKLYCIWLTDEIDVIKSIVILFYKGIRYAHLYSCCLIIFSYIVVLFIF